jgi:hypothetical protein
MLEAAIIADGDRRMPRPLTTAELPQGAAGFAEEPSDEHDRSKLAALRAAIDDGDASGLAEDGSFARVRARLGIATR